MSTSAKRLLSPTFVADALTQEVHELLALAHVRDILEALDSSSEGRTARWIDIHIIGESGSPKTAFANLNRLAAAGWALHQGPKGARIWKITDRGRKALEYSKKGDSFGFDRVGGAPHEDG